MNPAGSLHGDGVDLDGMLSVLQWQGWSFWQKLFPFNLQNYMWCFSFFVDVIFFCLLVVRVGKCCGTCFGMVTMLHSCANGATFIPWSDQCVVSLSKTRFCIHIS